jgi:type VI secretion system secreted protein Hcp
MATQWFLAVAGITGDSTVHGHEGELDITSWSWSLTGPPGSTGTGAASGRPDLHSLVVIASTGRATLPLIEACARGTRLASARLTGVRSGANIGTAFLTYALQRVVVASVSQTTDAGGAVSDEIALNFGQLQATFRPQNPDGSLGSPITIDIQR